MPWRLERPFNWVCSPGCHLQPYTDNGWYGTYFCCNDRIIECLVMFVRYNNFPKIISGLITVLLHMRRSLKTFEEWKMLHKRPYHEAFSVSFSHDCKAKIGWQNTCDVGKLAHFGKCSQFKCRHLSVSSSKRKYWGGVFTRISIITFRVKTKIEQTVNRWMTLVG